MKKNGVLVFLLILLYSCSQNKDETIIGFWKAEKIETDKDISESKLLEHKKRMNELAKKLSYNFEIDNTYKKRLEKQLEKGTYRLDGNILYIKPSTTQKEYPFKIVKLNSEKLIFAVKNSDGSNMTFFFKKVDK